MDSVSFTIVLYKLQQISIVCFYDVSGVCANLYAVCVSDLVECSICFDQIYELVKCLVFL